MRSWPVGFRLFVHRCAVVPFEASIGILAIWTGATSFLNYTVAARAFTSSLPEVFTVSFNLVYLVAGAFILCGLGWGYRNIESSGMILLATVMGVRVIALVVTAGFTPETTAAIIQGLTFGLASLIRLHSLLKNKILVFAEDIPEIVKRQAERQGIEP